MLALTVLSIVKTCPPSCRLKKEREHRKKQEATSLEETKEQIADLEHKLAHLKVSVGLLGLSFRYFAPQSKFVESSVRDLILVPDNYYFNL
jgi:hypothetical protein